MFEKCNDVTMVIFGIVCAFRPIQRKPNKRVRKGHDLKWARINEIHFRSFEYTKLTKIRNDCVRHVT